MEPRKKKRRKKNYVLFILSDSPTDKIKYHRYTRARVNFIKILVAILLLVLAGYISFSAFRNTLAISRETVLGSKITQLQEENSKLSEENQLLTDKVNILSETVNQKVTAEKEQEEKNMPTGFPMSGASDMEETTESLQVDDAEITRPLMIFKAGEETSVVAAGAGTVSMADADAAYGYQVWIDHGNGYVSIYRSGTEPKVKAGDEVTRGALLFEMSVDEDDENVSRMGYQIQKDGEYIEPGQVLEING